MAPSKVRSLLPLRILIVAAVLLTFSPLFTAEFVRWDDPYTIHHNPRLNPPSVDHLAYYWRHAELGLYIPLTYTVWSGLAALAHVEPDASGIALNPWIFHTANILLHTLAGLAAFELLLRLLRNPPAACIGALVFSLHPVQVESVAWISGLKDILCGLLSLSAIWQYLIAIESPDKRRRTIMLALATFTNLLALLAKPSAIVVGPICITLDVLLLRRSLQSALKSTAPMLLLAIPFAVIARLAQDVHNVVPTPPWFRPILACDALTFYLAKIALPLHLGIDYGLTPRYFQAHAMSYVLPLIPILIGLMLWKTRHRLAGAVAIIFLLALLPVLGLSTFQFQQFSAVTDHYLYLAMFADRARRRRAVRTAAKQAGHPHRIAHHRRLGAKSFAQSRTWHDDFTLFPHALAVNPQSSVACNNLATAYATRANLMSDSAPDAAASQAHDRQTAIALFHRAWTLNPSDPGPLESLAAAARQLGRRDQAADALRQRTPHPPGATSQRHRRHRHPSPQSHRRSLALGQPTQARTFIELYLKRNPDDAEMNALLAQLNQHPRATSTTTSTTHP